MIRIAICDDAPIMREVLKQRLFEYGKHRCLEHLIYEYDSGTKLLKDNKEFDLVFMDYEFRNDPKNNGISIAMRLRERQRHVTIIFLSCYPNVVFDSFSVGTFRFLVKPIELEKFTKAMDDYLECLEKETILTVRVEGVNRNIHTGDIKYIEADKKGSIIHFIADEKMRCSENISSLEKRLPKEFFYRCHKSYIIGFSFVKWYHYMSLELISGEQFVIGRNRYKEFCELYLEYLSRYR